MKKFKRFLSIVLAFVMVITLVLPVFADTYATSGTCGENVTWEFDVPTRTLTISGEGEMYWGYDDNSPWSTYKEIIKTVVIEDGVTNIADKAFQDHTALTSVSISDSVTFIGYNAFDSCVALTDFIIPNNVKIIDSYCFIDCLSLKNITIGKGVSYINYYAFYNCSALENVYISDLSSWCNITFYCHNGYDYSTPFAYAENLYLNGELLTDLVIPEDVTSIKDYAFYNYNNLESVTIHENLNSISEISFRYCNSLAEINVDENNETFKSIDGVLFSNNMIALLQYPAQKTGEAYTIPDNVLIIKDYAFYNNDYLENVTIPETVATIGTDTFYDCDGLTSITIPDEVVSIGNCAFYGCEKLDTVVMGSGITSIGDSAFSYYDSWDKLIAPDLYYNGTEEMWDSVSGGYDNYFNNIHYNCTNPDGHYTLTKVVNPSSCSDEGYSEYTCPCGYTIQKDYTYLDHTLSEWIIHHNPTCTSDGLRYKYCTVCGNWLIEEEIPATGHTAGEWQSVAPTCTEAGLEGKCCTSCGELLEGEIIAALGGSHSFGEWSTIDNKQARTCETCGYTEYKMLPGDLNGDGYVSSKDARIIVQIVAGLKEIKNEFYEIADVNGDGNISVIDARILLQLISGIRAEENYNIIPDNNIAAEPDESDIPKLTVSVNKTNVEIGETVTAYVSLSAESNLSSVIVDFVYDSNAFEIDSITSGTPIFNNDDDKVMINKDYADGKARFIGIAPYVPVTEDGNVFTVNLRAIAETDNSTFSVEVIEAATQDKNYNAVDIALGTVSTSVKVLNEEPTTEESTTNPSTPAGSPMLTVTADKTYINVGDTVTVKVNLSEKSGLSVLTIKANYNSSILEPIDMKSGDLGAVVNVKTGIATMATNTSYENAGTICTMTFKAVKSGEVNVTFIIKEACDVDLNNVKVETKYVKINVNESTTNPTEKPSEPSTEETTKRPEEPTTEESTTNPSTTGSPSLTLISDKTNAVVGDTITVSVKLCEKSGLSTLTIKLNYDSSVFKAVSMTSGDFGATVNVKTGVATMASATTYEDSGTVCTIKFEVIKAVDSTISINVTEATDADFNNVQVSTNVIKIKGLCADGHTWSEWEIIKESSCIDKGLKERKCTLCGSKESRDLSLSGHEYQSYVIAPTCNEDGYTNYICSVCGDNYNSDYIDATGHSYTWYTLNAPTCEKNGVLIGQCSVCENVKIKESPATGHKYVNGICVNCSGDSSGDAPTTNSPTIKVSSINATAGSQIKVIISLENNPGITSMMLNVNYDTDKLQLVSIEDCGNLGTAEHSDGLVSPYVLCWANDTATENITYSGKIAVLTFNVLDDAELGETPITVTYNYNNYEIIDKDMNPIKFVTVDGCVNIIDVIIGDINNDGKVNTLDRVVLTRYLAKWTEYPVESVNLIAADINCDGNVNTLDRVILTRHLAKWEGYEELPYIV